MKLRNSETKIEGFEIGKRDCNCFGWLFLFLSNLCKVNNFILQSNGLHSLLSKKKKGATVLPFPSFLFMKRETGQEERWSSSGLNISCNVVG
jgi:glutathione peroxidase-family protein